MPVPPDAQPSPPPDDSSMANAPRWLQARGFLDLFKDGNGSDPRVGSGRQDSSGGGTLSTASNSKTSSLSKLGATFIPVIIYLVVCVVIFIILRRRCSRVYAPRSIPGLRAPEFPTPPLPGGWLNWVVPFFKIPDTFVLNHGSLDGFFFLRFLKVVRNICLGGCIILWPVLFPIHATGGGGLTQLDLLTIGNVQDPKKLYAHALIAWVFFGFVLYMIVRECIFYVNLRQAYLSSPYYSQRISSRTVLLTGIPKEYLDEQRLRKLYGDSVRRVHIPRTTKALANLIKEREQTATRLERAEIELIQKANKAKQKQLKKSSKSSRRPEPPISATDSVTSRQDLVTLSSCSGNEPTPRGGHLVLELPGSYLQADGSSEKPGGASDLDTAAAKQDSKCETVKEEDPDYVHPYGLEASLPDVRGSVAAQYIPVQSRPYHRPLGNFGRRVDTIRWTRNRLRELNLQIFKMRRQVRRGDGNTLPAAFLEFDTQESAQAAHQVVAHHRPLQMSSRILGIHPDEVLWKSLRMSWWERIIRRFAIMSLVTAAVIFWSIPSAFIGLISQIDFLAKNIVFLAWIKHLPTVVLSFLQGFVPSIALSLWMAAIPIMLRVCGAQAGIPSATMVELFVQKAYFAFQVVQVFLVTTLTSAASAAFTDILENPIKAKDVLARNLPMASNFYLSYILIQCLASSGTNLMHVFSLIRHCGLSRLSNLPRAQYRTWHKLQPARWGGLFPIYANMGVIALSYACIAPLILIFAAGGMAVMRLVWRYNLIFVYDSGMDSKGLFYPHALLHLTIGLYLAELCLIGLFALHLSFGPLALMVMFFIFTGLVHFSLSDAIAPLLQNLPQTLAIEEEIQREEKAAADRAREQATARPGDQGGEPGAASSYFDPEQAFGENDARGDDDEDVETEDDEATVTNDRAIEGASGVKSALTEWLKSSTKSKVQAQAQNVGLPEMLEKLRFWAGDKYGDGPPSFLARWLHPEEYEDFIALRKMIPPDSLPIIGYPEDHKYRDYLPPELWTPKPTLWIPRDEARVSRQEVAHTKKYTPISDRGASLDEKGRVVVYMDQAPFDRPQIIL
ncbi:calcium-dependent channel, putative phosphate domain-containing protein [Hirsutella rhossiliensis]|uniref:Calcium-dependent channel, putative phosphate domain-containing protein n=1 Tax=Hirsutella rhossiliensis TaxID=111463 RepID=A0A9P8MQ31_9HYPO|nr:calcium-dependent channel, putative phosphate domain-containing protein [Hirsutella rhossiliensis]KAH0959079.1 calcium-dependent channel, putative phosphate domain-containing protein [Hirsutella rhossiliensis]